MITLDDYRELAPPGALDLIARLAGLVRGRRVLHLTGGRLGRGPAEALRAAVPLLGELGLDASWEITGGDAAYHATAGALRAALAGSERLVTDEALEHYLAMNRVNATKLRLDADVVVLHDVQPLSLVTGRASGRWVWHCHLDCAAPQQRAWSFVRPLASRCDAAVFSLPSFVNRVGVPAFVIAPSLDPLSEKHRAMPPHEIAAVLETLGVGQDKPFLLSSGAFTGDQDPLGAVNAYRLVKKHHDVRLVLAGAAADEEGAASLLADLREAARADPDIVVLEVPDDAYRQINALQRGSTLVLHKPLREAFGLAPAEAMWKGKPVVGSATGGLAQQIIDGATGYVVRSVEGAAFRIRHLLSNRELIPRMGAAAREHARRTFLITREVTESLALVARVTR